MNRPTALAVDAGELERFVSALFCYASEGGRVALRAFYEDDHEGRPFAIRDVPLHGTGLAPVVDAAVQLAELAAVEPQPVVFCPPVATFGPGRGASQQDLAEGLALSVEIDEAPAAARATLERLLGPATVVVASGGKWVDPATGEIEPKLHLHWRLTEPTPSPGQHAQLKQARALAAALAGGDRSNVPVVHPIRWPGSWHRKGPPRLARIVALNERAEVDLDEALGLLQDAAAARGLAVDRPQAHQPEGDVSPLRADDDLELLAALRDIPNPDLPWERWNYIGMALWGGTGGSAAGLAAFHAWSARSTKNAPQKTEARWRDYAASPPSSIGAGTIFHLAAEARRLRFDPDEIAAAAERKRAALGGNTAPARPQLTDWPSSRFAGEAPPIEWLVEGSIPLGVPGLVAAMGDTGKSMMLLDLARVVAFGAQTLQQPVFGGREAQEGTAVFITAEDDARTLHRRLAALDADGARHSQNGGRLIAVPLPDAGGPLVLFEAGRDGLAVTPACHRLLNQLRAIADLRLVVIDPLQAFTTAPINEDPAAGQFVCAQLGCLAAETGATVLAAHHMRKPARPITTLGEAREAIRGTTALVDGVRVAIALWPLEETAARAVCRDIGVDFAHGRIVQGGVVKANGPVFREVRTYCRDASGLLVDATLRAGGGVRRAEVRAALVAAIGAAAAAGHPYTKTGASGLFAQRSRLPAAVREMAKHRLEALAQQALESGEIVQCVGPASTIAKFLDLPGGAFALGSGIIVQGAAA